MNESLIPDNEDAASQEELAIEKALRPSLFLDFEGQDKIIMYSSEN